MSGQSSAIVPDTVSLSVRAWTFGHTTNGSKPVTLGYNRQ
jgi:hypothetical protein